MLASACSSEKKQKNHRYDDQQSDCSSSQNYRALASSEKKINSQASSRSMTKRSLPPYDAAVKRPSVVASESISNLDRSQES